MAGPIQKLPMLIKSKDQYTLIEQSNVFIKTADCQAVTGYATGTCAEASSKQQLGKFKALAS